MNNRTAEPARIAAAVRVQGLTVRIVQENSELLFYPLLSEVSLTLVPVPAPEEVATALVIPNP